MKNLSEVKSWFSELGLSPQVNPEALSFITERGALTLADLVIGAAMKGAAAQSALVAKDFVAQAAQMQELNERLAAQPLSDSLAQHREFLTVLLGELDAHRYGFAGLEKLRALLEGRDPREVEL